MHITFHAHCSTIVLCGKEQFFVSNKCNLNNMQRLFLFCMFVPLVTFERMKRGNYGRSDESAVCVAK